MNTNVFGQFAEALHASPLDQEATLELTLQVLAWLKLSREARIPPTMRVSAELIADAAAAISAFRSLGKESGLIGVAFSNANGRAFEQEALLNALRLATKLDKFGVLESLDSTDASVFFESRYSPQRSIPSELAELLAGIAARTPSGSTYVAWDSSGQITARISGKSGGTYSEMQSSTSVPALICLLAGRVAEFHRTNPLTEPSAVSGGKLRRFDTAVGFPPIGQKIDASLVKLDLFQRFPEKTNSGAVLAIRHLLAQAKRRVIVVVQNSVLFSAGAERAMREDLIDKGQVHSIISLPSGIFSSMNVACSVMVLEPEGGINSVQFIDANTDGYRKSTSKSRVQLNDVPGLLSLILTAAKSDAKISVPLPTIQANDYQLQPSRYIADPRSRQVSEILDASKIVTLGELVTTIRPTSVPKEETQTALLAGEVGAADLPQYGYITSCGRQVPAEGKSKAEFLLPNDILVVVKGSVGKVGIVPENAPPPGAGGWIAGQSLLILRASSQMIDPRALYVYLRSPIGQHLLNGITSGATIPLIMLKELRQLKVIVPSGAISKQAIDALAAESNAQDKIKQIQTEQAQFANGIWALD